MRLPDFALERYFQIYEFSVSHLLCSSDCESMSTGDLLALSPGASERFHDQWLGYTEYWGDPGLREDIAGTYTTVDSTRDVLCFAGAEEGIFAFMNATLSADDHIIVQTPAYQSLFEIGRGIGCQVTLWQTRHEDGWELDLDFLRRTIQPNTRAIIINSPHNPTGWTIRPQVQAELIGIAREYDLILFSDEVYRGMEHSTEPVPAMVDTYERGVSLGVLSKTEGLAGLRIGWIACRDRALLERISAYKDYLSMCNSAPSEFLARIALQNRDRIRARNAGIIRDNLAILDSFMAEHADSLAWVRPRGSSICFPRLLTGEPVDQWCDRLVKAHGVLLLPGTLYEPGYQHFRLGYGRRNMPDALDKLGEFLRGR